MYEADYLDLKDLERLYDEPGAQVTRAQTNHLTDFHLEYLKQARFFVISSGGMDGCDASPRGGVKGLLEVLGPKQVCFADWPGNNKIETLRNIAANPHVGLLFVFPGLDIFMRIAGRAGITTDAELRERLKEGEKLPKVAVVVDIDAVYFHCGKAINRAGLWKEASKVDRRSVPSPGLMMKVLAEIDDLGAEDLDDHYNDAMKNDLYG